jgi:hypothetical protein
MNWLRSPYRHNARYVANHDLLWLMLILAVPLALLTAGAWARWSFVIFCNDGPLGTMMAAQDSWDWGEPFCREWWICLAVVSLYALLALELAWAWWTRGRYEFRKP